MGALKAGVSLEPFSKSDEKYEKNKAKLIKFIETKTRYYLNELDIPGEVEKNKELCAKYLEKYKEKKQKPGEIKILTPDMNIEE
ncbi:MAG: hypothetical protein HC854_15850 [Flavobacterium sp.]|nr:hypothetical protein [Flavobacterium sp.]